MVRTYSNSEKYQATTIMLWSGVPGVILGVTLFILGLPSDLWTPKGARNFVSGVICALLLAISGVFLLGAAVFIEDSEVRNHLKNYRSDQPIINPAGPLLPLYSLAGVVAILVILGRYFYLLFILVSPSTIPLGNKLLTLEAHPKVAVNRIAYSPDGKSLISVGGSTLKLWEIDTGELKQTLNGHNGHIESFAVSPDGKTLASTGFVNIEIWDILTGQLLRTLDSSGVTSLAFSPDGKILVSASVKEWQLRLLTEIL